MHNFITMAQQKITFIDLQQLYAKISTFPASSIQMTKEKLSELMLEARPVLDAVPDIMEDQHTKWNMLSSQLHLINNLLRETNVRLQRAERLQQHHFIQSYKMRADVLESMVKLTEETRDKQMSRQAEVLRKMVQIQGFLSVMSTYISLHDRLSDLEVHTTGTGANTDC